MELGSTFTPPPDCDHASSLIHLFVSSLIGSLHSGDFLKTRPISHFIANLLPGVLVKEFLTP